MTKLVPNKVHIFSGCRDVCHGERGLLRYIVCGSIILRDRLENLQSLGSTNPNPWSVWVKLEILHPMRGAPYVNLRCYSVGPM